jgi:hypothetical protein
MPTKPPADGKHIVQDGEWVGNIAMKFGYTDWKNDVWMHGNNAELRKKHPDPRILAVNDVLYIPPWQEKKESCATEQRHKFKLKAPTEILRIRLLDPHNKPFKNEEYALELRFSPGGGNFKQQKTKTDADGILNETIPSTTYAGDLRLPRLNQSIKLRFGFLTPMDTGDPQLLFRGAQQRLRAIGFDPGPIDGKNSPATQGAIKSFQDYCDKYKGKKSWIIDAGEPDGELTEKTRKALIQFYGS